MCSIIFQHVPFHLINLVVFQCPWLAYSCKCCNGDVIPWCVHDGIHISYHIVYIHDDIHYISLSNLACDHLGKRSPSSNIQHIATSLHGMLSHASTGLLGDDMICKMLLTGHFQQAASFRCVAAITASFPWREVWAVEHHGLTLVSVIFTACTVNTMCAL